MELQKSKNASASGVRASEQEGEEKVRGLLAPMWHPAPSKRGCRWAPTKKWKPVSLPNATFGLGHRAVVLCGSRDAGCGEALCQVSAGEVVTGESGVQGQPTNSLSCGCRFSLRGCVSVQFTEFMTFLKWTVSEIKSPKGQVCFQFILLSLFYKRKFYCFYIKWINTEKD